MIHIDGDFKTNKKCTYHCSPTCHPGQIDPDKWHYGCLHKAWPQNEYGDYCPFVECDGDPEKCEIQKDAVIWRNVYYSGLKHAFYMDGFGNDSLTVCGKKRIIHSQDFTNKNDKPHCEACEKILYPDAEDE